ncbi:hypothetical protein [Mongoliitalea daihaiensis]|uniref:hypothetical protein n=1 Tax=Mongoliitalea daihaiensis TaxID=2782006 RepID=UPI001F1CCDEF|nr:hypothetical protein [Mongoliitalea daihaiensis]UJP66524.1 hypothetical protein IPZ59_07975 [Mongoliitalea daihaiensis]
MKKLQAQFYLVFGCMSILFISQSCNPESRERSEVETAYFPIQEFVEVLANKLDGQTVSRQATVNGSQERSEDVFALEDWLNEFDFFIQNDINKPALAAAYENTRSLEYLIHELKEGEKNKTQKVVVRYEDGKVKELSFFEKKENFFYTSEIRGAMFFNSGTEQLSHYVIETAQDVIWSKPNRMVIQGYIRY